MAHTPSSAFAVDESVTEYIGTTAIQKTRTMGEINSSFDESIGFAKLSSPRMLQISHLPRRLNESKDYPSDYVTYTPDNWDANTWGGIKPYKLFETTNKSYAVQPYAALCISSASSPVGYYLNTIGSKIRGTDDIRFLVDYPVDKMVFKVELTGYHTDSITEIMKGTSRPSATSINFDDFVASPADYKISNYSFSCYIWNDLTNKWVIKSNIRPCLVFNDHDPNSIRGVALRYMVMIMGLGSSMATFNLVTDKATHSNKYLSTSMDDGDFVFGSIPIGRYELYPIGSPASGTSITYGWNEVGATDAYTTYGFQTGKGNSEEPFPKFSSYTIVASSLANGEFIYEFLSSFGVYMSGTAPSDILPPKYLYYKRDIYLGKLNSEGSSVGDFVDAWHLPEYKEWNRNGSTVEQEYHEEVNDESWLMMDKSSIPTKPFFEENLAFDDMPNAIWFINKGTPSKKCFPKMFGFTDLPYGLWGISPDTKYTDDTPYKKDIPYKINFPKMYKLYKEREVRYRTLNVILKNYNCKITNDTELEFKVICKKKGK